MKQRIGTIAITAFLSIMGLLTLFLSTSIIFDLFDIRAREGNYVLSVVWANFLSAILYLVAAVGLQMRRRWAAVPLFVSLGVLAIGVILFIIHVRSGGLYETRTIGALMFRVTVNLVLAALVFYSRPAKGGHGLPVRNAVLALLPLTVFVAASCGSPQRHDHDHARPNGDAASHAHHDDAYGDEAIQLDDGRKWKADDHTLASVGRMKAEIDEFEQAELKDYQALSVSLREELDTLVAGCTMKGPSHDALHSWLAPYVQRVADLSTAGREAGDEIVADLKVSLGTFQDSFEPGY